MPKKLFGPQTKFGLAVLHVYFFAAKNWICIHTVFTLFARSTLKCVATSMSHFQHGKTGCF